MLQVTHLSICMDAPGYVLSQAHDPALGEPAPTLAPC